jgi:anaerobic selenocysteine-containing dehydrogenase
MAHTEKPAEDGLHFSFCRLCDSSCGLQAEVEQGRITALTPDQANPHSQGHLCVKGSSFLDVVYDPDRVLRPLRRQGPPGQFVEVSWEEAIADISQRMAAILQEDGSDAVAAYLGNPTFYGLSAMMSVMPFLGHFGVWKIFGSATQDASARAMASALLYGSANRMPIPDLPRCDFLLVIGANPLVSHGSILTAPMLRQDLDQIAERGRVVVIDPRRSETAARYEHVFVRPDTDGWLLGAMLNVVFQHGFADTALLSQKTLGWEKLREAVSEITPEAAAHHCGVAAEQIVDLAIAFAQTPRAAAYGRTGTCRGNFSTLVNFFICALNIVTGKFGIEGGWVFGDSPFEGVIPMSKGFAVKETRFGPQPYVIGHLPFGFLIDDILTEGAGQTRALLVESGNMLLTAPGGEELERALDALDLFVSVDLYINETNRFADYILPGTSFLEREDVPVMVVPHMIRPFTQYVDRVVPPVGEARDDHDILNDLGAAIHAHLAAAPGNSGYSHPEAPRFDPAAAIDGMFRYGGVKVRNESGDEEQLSLDLLKRYPHGIMLAEGLKCTDAWSKILHEDGLIHLWDALLDPEMQRLRAMPVQGSNELRLFSQRAHRSINSWMHNSNRLVRTQFPSLMMNPVDAEARNLVDGQLVDVSTQSGAMQVPVRISADVIAGSVCYPHGWGHRGNWRRANNTQGANVNVLAGKKVGDWLSASSLLDGIPVTIRGLEE